MKTEIGTDESVLGKLSSYIVKSGETALPAEVTARAKRHILDTLAAIVSGSQLRPGRLAKQFAESQLGKEEAQIICSPIRTTAINAALANGMMAHADETDDILPTCHFHPGSVILPSALAVAEREGADGTRFLRAVVLGYDVGSRIILSLGQEALEKVNRNTHCIGGSFGGAAAAASLLRLKNNQVRWALSYAVEQSGGLNDWGRDEEHIEKAFLLSGMPARNGVTAALMVHSGFTGLSDFFTGKNNLFEVTAPHSRPELVVESLGSHFTVMDTYLKKYPVGGPIQAALEALFILMETHGISSKEVEAIDVNLPLIGPVDNAKIPDINLQHLFAVVLIDGKLAFDMAHSYERMSDPAVVELKKRIKLTENKALFPPGALRQAIVEIKKKDGSTVKEYVQHWRGKPENPMTDQDVEDKCQDLFLPVLGADRTRKLIDVIWDIEKIGDMRELRQLLSI